MSWQRNHATPLVALYIAAMVSQVIRLEILSTATMVIHLTAPVAPLMAMTDILRIPQAAPFMEMTASRDTHLGVPSTEMMVLVRTVLEIPFTEAGAINAVVA